MVRLNKLRELTKDLKHRKGGSHLPLRFTGEQTDRVARGYTPVSQLLREILNSKGLVLSNRTEKYLSWFLKNLKRVCPKNWMSPVADSLKVVRGSCLWRDLSPMVRKTAHFGRRKRLTKADLSRSYLENQYHKIQVAAVFSYRSVRIRTKFE